MSLRSPRLVCGARPAALLLGRRLRLLAARPIKIACSFPSPVPCRRTAKMATPTLYLRAEASSLAGTRGQVNREDIGGASAAAPLNKARALAEKATVCSARRLAPAWRTRSKSAEPLSLRLRPHQRPQQTPRESPATSTCPSRSGASAMVGLLGGHESCGAFPSGHIREAGGPSQGLAELWAAVWHDGLRALHHRAQARRGRDLLRPGAGNDAPPVRPSVLRRRAQGAHSPDRAAATSPNEHTLAEHGRRGAGHRDSRSTTRRRSRRPPTGASCSVRGQAPASACYYARAPTWRAACIRRSSRRSAGDVEDSAKFLAALHRVKITDAPRDR